MLILFLRMALGRGAMNNIKIIFLGFLSLCSFTACTDAGVDVTGNEESPKIFLREKPKDGRYRFRLALLVAELRIENGCVQLIQGDDTENPYTPSWPAYTRLIETEDGYYIKIKKSRLDFGKTYHFGGSGGEEVMPDTPMHKACGSARKWFVGNVGN